MLKELHDNKNFSWPDGYRVGVTLTFDFQGGEDIRPLANGVMNHEEYTQAEYGPNTAIWRILGILKEEGVKATFMTCGAIAERYPEAVKAIIAAGHEVAGHGYHHEVARDLTREQETEVMKKTTAMILNRAGSRPYGWRSCTQSPNSIELLMAHGYLWNSNSFSHDLPFLWESDGRVLVELPRQPYGDGRTYGHRDSGNPNDTLVVWQGMFDDLHAEFEAGTDLRAVPVPPLYLGTAGTGAHAARHHPAHEAGRRRLVRDRQRGRPLVPRPCVQGRGPARRQGILIRPAPDSKKAAHSGGFFCLPGFSVGYLQM